jgi:hypothetical protein
VQKGDNAMGKREETRPLGWGRNRWECYIKTDFEERDSEFMDWNHGYQCSAVVSGVMNWRINQRKAQIC